MSETVTAQARDRQLTAALDRLSRDLRATSSIMIAFSGGVDSAFLVAAAARVLGPGKVTAATGISPSLAAAERTAAADFARGLGVSHLEVATAEFDNAAYRANTTSRCFFCKTALLDALTMVAEQRGIDRIATGTNADDARDFRPGIAAAAKRGATTPLLDAGLTKAQVRQTAAEWGLSIWDKPAAPCLASRVAYGIEVSPARLARVERAETALRASLAAAGIPVYNLRVRDLGDTARVEIDREHVPAVAARPELLRVVTEFDSVMLDPNGFRSGSLNEGDINGRRETVGAWRQDL